jgi:hypothetical protein
MTDNRIIDGMPVRQWLQIRKEAGLKIDPETAEVHQDWGNELDPYGVYGPPDDPEEQWYSCARLYWARSPGSEIWVSFYDLPEATCDALWEKHSRKQAFPAELEVPPTTTPDANTVVVANGPRTS